MSGPLGDPTGGAVRPGADRVFAGRYRLLGRRGRAADVALFEAVDALTDREVALKIVHPDLCARPGFADEFISAMHDAAAVRHPNLTEVLDVGEATWGGRPVSFAVCENLTGGSLRDLHDRGRRLSPSQVVMVGLDACRGLDAVHRAGLVHGDIRPANLVFGDDGRLRVTDLGLAGLVTEVMWAEPAGVDADKARYASPERARGGEAGAAGDVYSLALCLLEAVTGNLPFVGDSAVATLANRVDRLLPVSADLGPLAAVLERAGRPDPHDRSTAAEFGRALHQAAERLPRPAPLPLVGGGVFAAPAPAPAPAPVVSAPGAPSIETHSVDPTEAPAAPAAAAPDDRSAATAAATDGPVGVPAPAPVHSEPTGSPAVEADAAEVQPADPATAPPGPGADGRPHPDHDATSHADHDATSETQAPDGRVADGDPAHPTEPMRTAESPPVATASVRAVPILDSPGDPGAGSAGSGAEVAEGTPAGGTGAAGAAEAMPPPPPPPQAAPPLLRERRSRRALFATVAVVVLALVAGGLLAVWFARDTTREIPDLVGLEQGEALNAISTFDWDSTVVTEADDDVPAGTVIRTDPVAGERLDVGDAITIVVSTGPAPRALPELGGLTVDLATAALAELDLLLEIAEQPFDEVVPAGEIISWTVPDQPGLTAGDTVLPNTAVSVVVSAGPALRVVPDLTGLAPVDAEASLAGLGLVVAPLADEFSTAVPAGAVARQDPVAGTEVPRGATVSIAVSLGPDLVAVPPLADLGVDQARAALEAAGLVLGVVAGDPAGVNVLAEVGGVSIGAGATFPRGTAVDLTFAVPPPPDTTTTTLPPA